MDNNDEPPRKQSIPEFVPIPEDYTSIAILQKVINKSNAETNPRKRFSRGAALYAEGVRLALKDRCFSEAIAMVREGVCERKFVLKSSSTIAPLLFSLQSAGLLNEAEALYNDLVASSSATGTTDIFDDAASTVAVRILNAQKASSAKIKELLQNVPKGLLKRRLLFEVLDVALKRVDLQLVRDALTLAQARSIELWDCDYEKAFATMKEAASAAEWPQDTWPSAVAATTELLDQMQNSHPVMGRNIAEAVSNIGSHSKFDSVDLVTGNCSNCQSTLHGFTLTDAEFLQLSDDIITKLIIPSLPRRSHYETCSEIVPEEEINARRVRLDIFKETVGSGEFDAVIDGANVGYYGVSHWYAKAKKDLLLRNGRLESSLSPSDVNQMPLPVDVCPNFESVQVILEEAISKGYNPKIVFHERHTCPSSRLYGRNEELLAQWRADGRLISSPSFLNDDYCWLYACIEKRNCVIIFNDLMRDHHFLLLSQRSFIRWRQRHRITFRVSHRGGSLNIPAPYSTWVQRQVGTSVWHIPFMNAAILEQATNKKKPADALGKDGDDDCDQWLCVTL